MATHNGNVWIPEYQNCWVRRLVYNPYPTMSPTETPTVAPTISMVPSLAPTTAPTPLSMAPTKAPTESMATLERVVGTGQWGFSGDLGPAKSAELNGPAGLWLNTAMDLWIADQENHRVRLVTAEDDIISTVVGKLILFLFIGCNKLPCLFLRQRRKSLLWRWRTSDFCEHGVPSGCVC